MRCGAVLLLLVAVVGLNGCGFRPLYGRGSTNVPSALASVSVKPIADRSGQILHNFLLDRLNPGGSPGRPLYSLSVTLLEADQRLAVRSDDTATRANLILHAAFSLSRADTGAVVFKGNSVSTNSYNLLTSDYATLASRNAALRRAARELSDDIRTRLALALSAPANQKWLE